MELQATNLEITLLDASVANVVPGAVNQQVVVTRIVHVGGGANHNATITTIKFTPVNSDNADIIRARLFYTTAATFATTTPLGVPDSNMSNGIEFAFSQNIARGSTGYFWLAYDISPSASSCNTVDADQDSVDITVNPAHPVAFYTKNAPGNRLIVSGPSYCASTWSNTADDWISQVRFNTIDNSSGQDGAQSYGNYTCAGSTDVLKGFSYNLTINLTINGAFTQVIKAWFDWNQDGDFIDAGEEYTIGNITGPCAPCAAVTQIITIPTNAISGTTRMRITEKYNTGATPCETGIWGETEDYTINVMNSHCSNSIQDEDETGVDCGGADCPSCFNYCASTYANTSEDWISNVKFNTINNTTGIETSLSYGNYTSMQTEVSRDSTYQLSVSVSIIGGPFTHYVKAWFDWNQNGSFLDAGEEFNLGSRTSPGGGCNPCAALTANIAIPAGATLGTTRMRVIQQYNSAPTPCNAHPTTFGETEDYTINVLNTPPCYLVADAGPDTLICEGGAALLKVTAGGINKAILNGSPTSSSAQNGNMFDITAVNTIIIEKFETYLQSGLADYAIYYKQGGYSGYEDNPSAWTFLGNASNILSASPALTTIPIPVNVSIPAGQTYSFYLTTTNYVLQEYATGASQGAVFSSDANIQFKQGIAKQYPFGATFPSVPPASRVWRGKIHYSTLVAADYLWSTTETTQNITVAPTMTTTYYVTTSESGNPSCQYTDSVTVNTVPASYCHCINGIQDGDETGVDCGGADCPSCSYCSSTWSNQSDDWISRVRFNTIDNASGQNGPTSYGDYTHISTDVSKGFSYNMRVNLTINGAWTQYIKAWADWNQDGDFDDPGEEYNIGNITGACTPCGDVTASIMVPVNALPGTTRMRITEKYSTGATPCETGTYGETEDYSINVTNPPTAGPDFYINDASLVGDVYTTAIGADAPGCGTPSNPCRTVQYVLDNYSLNGDTIFVDAGIYSDTNILVVADTVVIQGVSSTATIFDGTSGGTVSRCFNIQTSGNVLKDIQIRNYNVSGAALPRGGAMQITGVASKTIIDGVVIRNCSANSGGGIYLDADSLIIRNASLIRNTTVSTPQQGGGIYVENNTDYVLFEKTSISYNVLNQQGGGIYVKGGNTNIFLAACTLDSNHVYSEGGAIYVTGVANLTMDNTRIGKSGLSNRAALAGGIYFNGASLKIDSSFISKNIANTAGGILIEGGNAIITLSQIDSNIAMAGTAGGIKSYGGVKKLVLSKVKIFHNQSSGNGSAISFGDSLMMTNCLLYENVSTGGGSTAALEIHSFGYANLLNSTIADNTAASGNGGVYGNNVNKVNIANCIIYGNGSNDIIQAGANPVNVVYSNYGTGSWTGINSNNTTAPPLFINPANDDYSISFSSAAYNTALDSVAPADDIVGNPRPMGGRTDMGCYEVFTNHTIITLFPSIDTLCAGDTLLVPYTASGTFNPGNIFFVQLSDTAGNFTSPDTIGQLADTLSGTITAMIPLTAVAGTGYRVKIVASNPPAVGMDTGNIVIHSLPVISVTNDTSVCQGDSLQLSASGGLSYSWLPLTGLSNPFIANPKASPPIDTTYIVTVTDNNGCSDTAGTNVLVHPVYFVNMADTICAGDSIFLAGGWQNTAGTYYDTLFSANNCDSIVETILTVNALPVLFMSITDTLLCAGDSIQLNVSSVGGISYQWSPSAGLSDSSVQNPLAFPLVSTLYTVTVSSAEGCSDAASVLITVLPSPLANITPLSATAFCMGDSVILRSDSISGNQWYRDGALIAGATGHNYTAMMPGAYTLTVSNGTCMDSTLSPVMVTVYPIPVANITALGPTTFCMGDSVTLQSDSASGNQWYKDGILISGATGQIYAAAESGSYTLKVTGTGGCADSTAAGMLVTVNSLFNPVVTIQVSPNDTVCNGTMVTFMPEIVSDSGATPSWQWQKNGLDIPGANASVYAEVFSLGGDSLRLIMTISESCVLRQADTSAYITMTVFRPPFITQQPLNINVCPGIDSGFALIAGGDGLIYQWQENTGGGFLNLADGGGYSGTMTNKLRLINISQAKDGNTYRCIVSGICAPPDTSDIAMLSVVPAPGITAQSADASVCEGGDTTFSIMASGTGLEYRWQADTGTGFFFLANGGVYSGVGTAVLSLSGIVIGMDGYVYRCIVSGSCAPNDTSSSALLVVNPSLSPSVSIQSDANNVCPGTLVTFSISSVVDSGATPLWRWQVNGSMVGSSTVYSSSTLGDGDTVRLIMAPAESCALPPVDTSNLIIMSVTASALNPQVNIQASPSGAICVGTNVLFTIQSVTDSGASPSWEWQLNGNPVGFTTTYSSSSLNNGDQIRLIMTVSESCVALPSDTSNIIIMSVSSGLTANAGIDDTICFGESTEIGGSPTASGGAGGYTYSWAPAATLNNAAVSNPISTPTGDTRYIVTVMDAVGCIAIDSVTVYVNALPFADAGVDDTLCIGQNKQIGGLPTAGGTVGPYTYLWVPAMNLDDPAVANPVAEPGTTTIYFVTVTDANGCKNIDSVQLVVIPLPGINVNDTNLCIGDTIQLQAQGGTDYLWIPASGLSDPIISNPMAFPDTTTHYMIIVSSTDCGIDTAYILITVNPLPVISMISDTNILAGAPLQLYASGGISYQWIPGIGLDNPFSATPVAQLFEDMVYTVWVTDLNGCRASDSIFIDVILLVEVFVPEMFSPNGDGMNDELFVNSLGLKSIDFKLFNRWGTLVFETTNTAIGWDGIYKGKAQDMDTYTYTLKAETEEGQTQEWSGKVLLLR